jgi:hypothetical protein
MKEFKDIISYSLLVIICSCLTIAFTAGVYSVYKVVKYRFKKKNYSKNNAKISVCERCEYPEIDETLCETCRDNPNRKKSPCPKCKNFMDIKCEGMRLKSCIFTPCVRPEDVQECNHFSRKIFRQMEK